MSIGRITNIYAHRHNGVEYKLFTLVDSRWRISWTLVFSDVSEENVIQADWVDTYDVNVDDISVRSDCCEKNNKVRT